MEDFPFDISWAPKLERRIRALTEQALHSPDTAMRSIQTEIQRTFEAQFPNEKDFFGKLALCYEQIAPHFDAIRKRAAAQILADTPRSRSYWKLISVANMQHPASPIVLICEPESFGRTKVRALAALTEAQMCQGTGEQKAKAALTAAVAVVEVYKVYLAKLEVLLFLANEGKHPGKNSKPGHLCRVLAEQCKNSKIKTSKMVDPDIVHLRNAACHGHFEYQGHRRLHLWDASGDWSQPTTTSQVLRKARQALNSAHAFECALQAFTFQFYLDLLGPIVPKMARLIRGELDTEELEWINSEYRGRERTHLRNIGKFGVLFGRGEDVRTIRKQTQSPLEQVAHL